MQPPRIKNEELSFPPVGHVLVSVVEARDLIQNSLSELDPYVRVRVGDAENRTETCYNTPNPIWLKEWRSVSTEDAGSKGSILGDIVGTLNPFNGLKMFGRSNSSPNGSNKAPVAKSPNGPNGSNGSAADGKRGDLPFDLGSTVNNLFRNGEERPISPLTPPAPTGVPSHSSARSTDPASDSGTDIDDSGRGMDDSGTMKKVPEGHMEGEDERWLHQVRPQ